jgi:hypothetical protein
MNFVMRYISNLFANVAEDRKRLSSMFNKKALTSFTSTHFVLVGVAIMGFGLITVLYLIQMSQDLRQQAFNNTPACHYNPVNVEFRRDDPTDTKPWMSGDALQNSDRKVLVGDKIEVNCFARNGSILLPGGAYTVTRTHQGITTSFQLPANAFKTSQEVRNWEVKEPGRYAFTCRNNAGCTDTDTLIVSEKPQASPSPVPSPTVSPSPTISPSPTVIPKPTVSPSPSPSVGACPHPSIADLNKDCIVNLLDFDLFLQEFLKNK